MPIESRQVASLASLVQLPERITELAREEEREQGIKRDEELAEVLDRINKRIIYLATELARQILCHRCGMSPEEVDALMQGELPPVD